MPGDRSQSLVTSAATPEADAALAIIALGSNLGDSDVTILAAMDRLQSLSDSPLLKSSLLRTAPVDCPPGSPDFVNAVVGLIPREGETPESLLKKLLEIEPKFGARPRIVTNAPRHLDLDLIAFGSETRDTPELKLPHPLAHRREFVLRPLAEISPDLKLPGQSKPVAQLLSAVTSS
jgi:2-amino-4-hydroxy-6-hydroxymethyldihydropteridine diphosphokinase